jgi:hypothetical protein
MWDLGFEVVEQARASRHGRSEVRREERVRSDAAVTILHEGREVARGWCLDRSASGARVIVASADGYAIGRSVTMGIGDDMFAFRVVWAFVQESTCVLGLERDLMMESGERPCVAAVEPTVISRAARVRRRRSGAAPRSRRTSLASCRRVP